MKAVITFTDDNGEETVVKGEERDLGDLHVGDVTDKLAAVEEYLRRVTGLRVRIETEV